MADKSRNHNYTVKSLGTLVPSQLEKETVVAHDKLYEALGGDIRGYVADRLQMTPEELSRALAEEQIEGTALAIYNIEARAQSVIIGDQTGIGKGRQAAALVRYGLLAGYLPIFLTDRYTLFSDMYRDCKALGINQARPLILNTKVSIVDFDKPCEDESSKAEDEIWSPEEEDTDEQELAQLYTRQYEEVYKSPKKAELELMYKEGDIPGKRYEYVMLTYSQLKDARKDRTRLDFLTELCKKHRVLFVFDEAHKSSSVSAGKVSIITQSINFILEQAPQTQCVFLSATFAKRPECLITFMRQTMLNSLATHNTLQLAFANGGVPMQEYVASKLAREGQMIRREHSNENIPEPVYTYLEENLNLHSELFDKVMYWFREIVHLSDEIKLFMKSAEADGLEVFRVYPTRQQLFYINKILLLSLKARDVAEAAVREVNEGRSVVIGMSDTLECVLRDTLDSDSKENLRGDFSSILLRLLDKSIRNPRNPKQTVFDLEFSMADNPLDLMLKADELKAFVEQIRMGIKDEIFHLPMSPIDVIRQLITQETFTDKKGETRNIRFEECTGRARQLEYLSPEGDDEFVNVTLKSRKKRHSNHIFNDFQNNKLDVILINACGAIGASAHATPTIEVPEEEVRQRKMLIVQNDLDVNIDLQKRGRINRTGQLEDIPPLYEYIITAIPSEKRLNMMLRAKLRSLSANTTANQDQDKRHADFIDITNKYGNQIAAEFLAGNPETAALLGLNKSATASQLLARIAMLGVSEQQEIIEEVFSAYLNLEQELRRINQWDLEREYRDFEAVFVNEEVFTAPIDSAPLAGASMLSTFKCRHRTFPYDSLTLLESFEESKLPYGDKPYYSDELQKEIKKYFTVENKKIKEKFKERRNRLFQSSVALLLKYNIPENEAVKIVELSQNFEYNDFLINDLICEHPQMKRMVRKLKAYSEDYYDTEVREKKELQSKRAQKQRLLNALQKAEIGRGYLNISQALPVDERVDRIMAVLKEIRFDKNPAKRFLPGKVQFVFALSAIHKELVLNLVEKGSMNNYDRLMEILYSQRWNFNAVTWDKEIAKYNNRVLERKIITGNILGAFANPLISKMHPHFITFSLASDKGSKDEIKTERGLLLPMSGENLDKIMSTVTLPLGIGLKYATARNQVFTISGIGIDFSLVPFYIKGDDKLKYYVNVTEKVSREFEEDTRFDSIRELFKASLVTSPFNRGRTSKRTPVKYSTNALEADSLEFMQIITLLVSLRAVIMIPRSFVTVGEMKEFAGTRTQESNSNWPNLDWKKSLIMPPVKEQVQLRISPPQIRESSSNLVDEYTPETLLCIRTLSLQGGSLNEPETFNKLRTLYFEWLNSAKSVSYKNDINWQRVCLNLVNELHSKIVNAKKIPNIDFKDNVLRCLMDEVNKYELSPVGEIISRYNEEMLFMSPPVEEVQKFLDSCFCDPRLDKIRQSLENYINGVTSIISDV